MKGAGILPRCTGLRSFSWGSGGSLGCITLGSVSLQGRGTGTWCGMGEGSASLLRCVGLQNQHRSEGGEMHSDIYPRPSTYS